MQPSFVPVRWFLSLVWSSYTKYSRMTVKMNVFSNKKTGLKHHFASVFRVFARTLEFLDLFLLTVSEMLTQLDCDKFKWIDMIPILLLEQKWPRVRSNWATPTLKALEQTSQKADLIPINHQPFMSTDGLIQTERTWEELQRRMKEYSQIQEQKACCINPRRPEALTPAKGASSDLRKGSIHFHSQQKFTL